MGDAAQPRPPIRALPDRSACDAAPEPGGAVQAAACSSERLSLRLPVHPSSVGIGRRAAAQFAEEVALDDATQWCVRVAVSEAITNVVLHAHPATEDALTPHFVLLAEAGSAGCTVTVSDDGVGLQARSDSPGVGLGLGLIARSCDEIALDAGPRGGTSVRMTFRRS